MKASHWVLLAAAGASGAMLLPHFRVVSTAAFPLQDPPIQAAGDGSQGGAASIDLVGPLKREALELAPVSDPFGPRRWNAAPAPFKSAAPRTGAAAPAAPVVPAFPYRYAGRVDVGRALKEAYFVRASGELVPVMPGEVVDGVWRIDKLTSEHVELTYLPQRQSQALSLASLTSEAAPASSPRASAAMEEPAPRMTNEAPSIASRGSGGDGNGGPLGLPAATSLARLGNEVPTRGSMPTDTSARGSAAPTGSFPSGPTPSGRLGEATPAGKPGPQ